MPRVLRVILGATISPLLISFFSYIPAFLLSPAATMTSGVLLFLILDAVAFILLFLFCATLCHVLLTRKGSDSLIDYMRTMFWIATIIVFAYTIADYQFTFGNGGSEYHYGVQVIKNGNFSVGGLALLAAESIFTAISLACSFAMFWYVAVRPYRQAS